MTAEERTPDELEALAYQHPGSQIQVHESSDTAFLEVAGRRYYAISTPREHRDDYDPEPAPGQDERAREVLDPVELAGYYRQKGRRR